MSERLTDDFLMAVSRGGVWVTTSESEAMANEIIKLRSPPAQGVTESHRVKVARLADALPVDEDVQRKVDRMMAEASAKYGPSRKMFALSEEEREALRFLRNEVGNYMLGPRTTRALAILDRLTRTEGK